MVVELLVLHSVVVARHRQSLMPFRIRSCRHPVSMLQPLRLLLIIIALWIVVPQCSAFSIHGYWFSSWTQETHVSGAERRILAARQQQDQQDDEVSSSSAGTASTKSSSKQLLVAATTQRRNLARWEDLFERLKVYKEIHGHCNVPYRYRSEKDGVTVLPHLGVWVIRQRYECSYDSQLYQLRRERLDSIGFEWQVRDSTQSEKYDAQWDAMFLELQRYHQEQGDCLVPYRYNKGTTVDGRSLGRWVQAQKTRYVGGRMKRDRLVKLQSLDFEFDGDSDYPSCKLTGFLERWNIMLERLERYRATNGNCRVPPVYETDPELGHWVHRQQKSYETLSLVQREQLDRIGFVVDRRRRQWTDMYERLRDYQKIHGDCRVPRGYLLDVSLGNWVASQRSKYSNLPPERRQLLEEIGFIPLPFVTRTT
jgi:Helicase associated domain